MQLHLELHHLVWDIMSLASLVSLLLMPKLLTEGCNRKLPAKLQIFFGSEFKELLCTTSLTKIRVSLILY